MEPWLLLIHQIPAKPDYLRVKVGRRLQQVGAVAVKSTVYVLPDQASCRENLEWIVREIKDEGGEALLCQTTLVAGQDDEGLRQLFRDARDSDFDALAEEAKELIQDAEPAKAKAALGRLERKLGAIRELDFFGAPSRGRAEEALDRLRSLLRRDQSEEPTTSGGGEFHRRTWVTRRGIEEDRIASAWLIRRFIDPAARFRFVPESEPEREGELRFDMFGGEFTHEGRRCTFEVLVDRFLPDEDALRAIAEVIHDIDLADEEFDRPETPGIERLIQGLVRLEGEDLARLDRGATLLDALYVAFGGTESGSGAT